MDVFLAIDGGGTGCRALLADAAGRVLARAEGGPANVSTAPEAAEATVVALAAEVLRMAGLPRATAAGLGLAGVNAGAGAALADAVPADHVRLVSDAVTGALGALGPRDGVVAAIGTGAAYARREGRDIRLAGGHGLVLGDAASGAWLGREALSAALCAHDGSAPMTPYLAALLARHDGLPGIMRFAQTARPADFAALAPELVALAGTDAAADPAARAIMARADAEIIATVTALRGPNRLPVAFTGGLGRIFHDRLADRLPVITPLGPALDGALALAREAARSGAGAAIMERIPQ